MTCDIVMGMLIRRKAERLLGWKAEKGIKEMCRDAWKWQ